MSLIVCFSGQIGSGKSSVSQTVAETLGWVRTGFSDYLRAELERTGGDPTSRLALQDLGQSLVETNPLEFCRSVLNRGGFTPGGNLVVDGIRHITIYDTLVQLAPPSVPKLLFLEAVQKNRENRVQTRTDSIDLARAEIHPVEAELRDQLPLRADLRIDANRSFKDVVSECLEVINLWQATSTK